MISFLSSISKVIIELSAWITIILFAVFGYMFILTDEQNTVAKFTYLSHDNNNIYAHAFVGGIIGLIAGIIFAAFLFGTLAVLYDMRDSLRAIVEQLPPKSVAGASIPRAKRVEPHLP